MTQLKAKQMDKNEAWEQSGSVAESNPGGQGRPFRRVIGRKTKKLQRLTVPGQSGTAN